LRTVPDAIVVPTISLISRGDRTLVYINDGGKAKEVVVVPGLQTDGYTQVTGITAGQQIVTSGQSDLETGAELDVQTKTDGGKA
jgi:hypothetical protein